MEKERKILIIALAAVIVALAAGIGYMLLNSSVEYQTINLSNGTTVEVPKTDDAKWTVDGYGIRTYSAPSKNTVLTSYNSEENPNLAGAMGFAVARDVLLNGSASVERYNGYEIQENNINGTDIYMVYISNNQTHDNILMGSKDLDVLKHMIDSLVFGDPNAVKNATATSEPVSSAPAKNTTDDKNKYSEEDLMDAAQYGYYTGYSDGYDDSYSYYDDYSYDDYDYDDSSYSSSSYSSDSSSSSVETTTSSSYEE